LEPEILSMERWPRLGGIDAVANAANIKERWPRLCGIDAVANAAKI
jgi:hypothetical protein